MRLLVSVRSAAEVGPALAGGADIIDAKEPAAGPLGPVPPHVLRQIAAAVPRHVPLSVALGEATEMAGVGAAVAETGRSVGERAELYVKLGLAGTSGRGAALLASAAVEEAGRCDGMRVILVAYADAAAAGSPVPGEVVCIAARAGADGVLLDTFRKDGRDLFAHMDEDMLRAWVLGAAREDLAVALAGSLDRGGVSRIARLPVQVVGVRTAACAGGRSGGVSREMVSGLKAALAQNASARPCLKAL